MRLVLGSGLSLVGVGIAAGLALSALATRYLGALVYGVSPTDPLVFVSVSTLLLTVATLACYVPARRAMRVDPITALRSV